MRTVYTQYLFLMISTDVVVFYFSISRTSGELDSSLSPHTFA